MTKIYLIRHAEAEGNLYRRIQGHYDGKVTRRGMLQIDALAERFKDIPIDAVYSSDLKRAMQTASAITGPRDLKLDTTPRLREVCMGVWEDRTWGDIEIEDPRQLAYFTSDPYKWNVEGSESFPELSMRITGIINELASKHDGETIALISHGMAIRVYLCAAMGIPSSDIGRVPHGDNTGVALLETDETRTDIKYFNDNSHLNESISTFARQSWWKGSSGADKNNLRFEVMDPRKEKDLYLKCYAESWMAAHGDLNGFIPELYQKGAENHAAADPAALVKAMRKDEFVGIVELDTVTDREKNCGRLCLCFILPEHRGKGYGIQLIGHAVSVFRKLGRKSLRLHVAESNTKAAEFYKYCGFSQIGADNGSGGRLLLMETEL
ncbi:MAG: bifunctional histidine phosphatase family protein/GNAT family N-acetyltransferase [Oscillospiraceae bacterium]|nr:bifunctional histidine phosphatase family protein/GNAT family N-acetyltransferase [Oscillospiraceae bacterium]